MGRASEGGPPRAAIEPPSRREFDPSSPHTQVGRPPPRGGARAGMHPELALLSEPHNAKKPIKGAERYVHPNSFSSERSPIIPRPAPQPNTLYHTRRNTPSQHAQVYAQPHSPPSQMVSAPRQAHLIRQDARAHLNAVGQGSRHPSQHTHSGANHRPQARMAPPAAQASPQRSSPLTPPIQRQVVPPEESTMSARRRHGPADDGYNPQGVDPWGLEQNQTTGRAQPSHQSQGSSPLGQSVAAVQNLVNQSGGGEAINFVTDRLNEIVHYIQSSQSGTGIPAPVFEHLNQFQRQLQATGIERQYAEDLIEQTKARIRLNQLEKQVILAQLGQVLAQNLSCVNPLTPPPGAKKNVLAFIGPTGVGKTTTIAKIAAHAQLTHEMPVTLISTDTFRMAAVEQLSRYASILDCPALAAHTPEDLWKHIDDAETPLVLVDTTGRNPKTQGQLKALAELFGEGWYGRTVLTVAANTREQDLRPIVEGFSTLKYNMVAVTKLDETYALGTVYNVSKFTKCPISWTTNGQRVPEDIELANAEMLAVKIIMEAISHKV